METIKFRYRLTEEDYTRLYIWAIFEKSRLLRLFNKYLIYVLGAFLIGVCYITSLSIEFYGLIILMTFLPLLLRLFTKNSAKKQYRSNKILQENDIETTLSDEGIGEVLGETQTFVKWANISRVYESHDMILFMTDSIRVSAIRKRLLSEEQIRAFKETIVNKVHKKVIKSLKV
ncbi:YcxB family protein [Mycoplasmatota bacterium WC30]